MKSIEIFNETNSNLNKAVNMAFEVTLRKIEEASKVGRTHSRRFSKRRNQRWCEQLS